MRRERLLAIAIALALALLAVTAAVTWTRADRIQWPPAG
jgi:hypothetical protein